MALEDDMRTAALRASAARRVGDMETCQFCTETVENINAQIVRRDRNADWDALVDNRHG